MTPNSFILVILLALVVGYTLLTYSSSHTASLSNLTTEERQLITKIAAANKANRNRIETFDCLFERKSIRENDLTTYSGRFALGKDKVYLREIITDGDEGIVLIESDGKNWHTEPSSPKAIRFETSTPREHARILAGAPWNKMDGDIGSRLLNMSNEYDRIRSAKKTTIDESPFIEVEIDQRLASDPPDRYRFKQMCRFSISENYLPVRIESYQISGQGDSNRIYIKEVTKIKSFNTNDQPIYLPIEYRDVFYRDGQQWREGKYRVNVDSIKINQPLPDSLFTITMDPCDLVYDKDRELNWKVPAQGVIGANAPDFTLDALTGGKIALSDIKEAVIVLDFWATWCGPCQKMLPVLNSLNTWARDNNKSVAFYGITSEQADVVSSFKKKYSSDIPILLDTKEGHVYKAYKGLGIPYVIIISNGIIQNVFIGAGGEPPVLEQYLKDMILSAIEAGHKNNP